MTKSTSINLFNTLLLGAEIFIPVIHCYYSFIPTCIIISFQVQTVDAEEVEVRFQRKSGSCYVWPDIDDTSVIGHEDVMSVLPVPDIDGRGRHSFPQTQ